MVLVLTGVLVSDGLQQAVCRILTHTENGGEGRPLSPDLQQLQVTLRSHSQQPEAADSPRVDGHLLPRKTVSRKKLLENLLVYLQSWAALTNRHSTGRTSADLQLQYQLSLEAFYWLFVSVCAAALHREPRTAVLQHTNTCWCFSNTCIYFQPIFLLCVCHITQIM